MLVKDLMSRLQASVPHLHDTLTISQLVHFSTLSSDFLHRTKGAFPTSPTHLPIEFLSRCLNHLTQPRSAWAQLWYEMYPNSCLMTCLYDSQHFKNHGTPTRVRGDDKLIIPEHTFKPPIERQCPRCTQDSGNTGNESNTRQYPPVYGYLFTIGGIETLQYYIRRCDRCLTTYYPTFETQGGLRKYYTPKDRQTPAFIYVTRHYFITAELVEHFNKLQMLAVVSVFNLANSYNVIHSRKGAPNDHHNPRYTRHLSSRVCSLALDIYRLLKVYSRRGLRLQIPSKGNDEVRFVGAMANHLEWLKLEGSKFASHLCSICAQVSPIPDSSDASFLRAVVTDGVTIGFWRCSASEEQLLMLEPGRQPGVCQTPLKRIKDRYCPEHTALLKGMCQAQPCTLPCTPGAKTCHLLKHIEAYQNFVERNSSLFGLPNRLKRPGSSLPMDPSVLLDDTGDIELSGQALLNYDAEERGHEGARDGGEKHQKNCLSRCKTHNEQLVVATCGVILARKTFYKSEGVSQVKEFLLEVFPAELPQIIFYDNACNLFSHIRTNPDDTKAFSNTILPVDTFHFRSHKESHTSCRQNNDPNLFPELKGPDGSWRFNASAAEICNAWFGKFDSMCRNMKPVRYEFHLEVMIEEHNEWLCENIQKRPNTTFCANIPYKTVPL